MKKIVLVLLLISITIGCSGRQLTNNDQSKSAVFKASSDIDYF
ncbi:MAG: hypothetical protein ACI8P9_005212 [Parasphingorhabdus sp.]|jgi:hypothetical protein